MRMFLVLMHMSLETNQFKNLRTFSFAQMASYIISDLDRFLHRKWSEIFPQRLLGAHATLAALRDSPDNGCGKPVVSDFEILLTHAPKKLKTFSLFLRLFWFLAIHNYTSNSIIPKTCYLTGKMSGEESLLCSRLSSTITGELGKVSPCLPATGDPASE